MVALLGILSELEVQFIRERVRVAMATKKAAAIAAGQKWQCGRPRTVTPEIINHVNVLRERGVSIREIGRKLGLSKTSVLRALSVPKSEG